MFGIGFTELVLIAVVLIVVVGPDKLPELFRTLGKLAGEVKKGSDELKRTVKAEASSLKEEAVPVVNVTSAGSSKSSDSATSVTAEATVDSLEPELSFKANATWRSGAGSPGSDYQSEESTAATVIDFKREEAVAETPTQKVAVSGSTTNVAINNDSDASQKKNETLT